MHPQAFDYVAEHANPAPGLRVLDIGGQDMNGTVRGLFPGAAVYHSLDIADGPGVDIVADAATWRPSKLATPYDVVVCCEVFEHTPAWRDIVKTAHDVLRPGGRFIATMAGPGRPEHSGRRAALEMDPDEHYANIHPRQLLEACTEAGFITVVGDVAGGSTSPDRPTEDLRVVARRPLGVHLVTSVYGGRDPDMIGQVPQVPSAEYGRLSYTLVTDGLDGVTQEYRPGRVYPDVTLFDAPSTDPRQRARWAKFLPGQVIPEVAAPGDVVVWIAGNVELHHPGFLAMVVGALGDADYAAWRNPTCQTMAELAAACVREHPDRHDIVEFVAHYGGARAGGPMAVAHGVAPDRVPGYRAIWQLGVMATRVNDRTELVGTDVITAMDLWPRSAAASEFPFAVHRHGARVADLPGGSGGLAAHIADGWFTLHPHKDRT